MLLHSAESLQLCPVAQKGERLSVRLLLYLQELLRYKGATEEHLSHHLKQEQGAPALSWSTEHATAPLADEGMEYKRARGARTLDFLSTSRWASACGQCLFFDEPSYSHS